MRRLLTSVVLGFALVAGSVPVRAASDPVIEGRTAGIELCPQSVCGYAVFVSIFDGRVGGIPRTFGTVSVAVTHEDLPDPGQSADITGGVWRIRLLGGRVFTGLVLSGELTNNGDDTFTVDAELLILRGGTGTFSFNGILSHQVFPPTIEGVLFQ